MVVVTQLPALAMHVALLLLVAVPAVAEAPLGADQTAVRCAGAGFAAGACIVAEEDSELDAEPSLGLVQRASLKRLHEVRLGELVTQNASKAQPFRHTLDRQAFRAAVQPCLNDPELRGDVPFTVSARMQMEVFRELGMVDKLPRCKRPREKLAFLTYIVPDNATVEHKNYIAKVICAVWGSLVTLVMLWSVYAVLRVPRKPDYKEKVQLRLADEQAAWDRGLFSWMNLSWVDGLMGRYGKCLHSVIDDDELTETTRQTDFKPYIVFRELWKEQIKTVGIENASIVKGLFHLVGLKATCGLCFCVALEVSMSMVGMVVALDKFLKLLEDMNVQQEEHPEAPISYLEPTVMIVLLIFGVPMFYRTSSIIVSLLDGYYTNVCAAGLASVVFEKALRIPAGACAPPKENEESPFGVTQAESNTRPNLVQLLNVDIVDCWGYLLKTCVYVACAPFMFVVLFGMLIKRVHMAGLVGFLYVIPCTLITLQTGRINARYWMRYQGYMDTRMRFLTETMLHIRTIKSLAWEATSYEKLKAARNAELGQMWNCAMIHACMGAIGSTIPWGTVLLALFFTLSTKGFIAAHEIIIIQRIMGSLLASVGVMMEGASKFVTVPNSFRRIRTFLAEPDKPRDVVRPPPPDAPNGPSLRIRGSFSFTEGSAPIMRDLDLAIPKGELVGVIGAVASGKSAFLQIILGELFPHGAKGTSWVEAPNIDNSELAYCGQVPWIFEGTLRENVLMDATLDTERYYKALHGAALTSDLQILPGADMVTIGSHGIRLSGGQRARVGLARAAYMKTDVVLIDDPFASVDVPTGHHIFTELLCGPLMSARTRVVVLQPNAARLHKFDRLLLFEQGDLVSSGTPAEVMEHAAFSRLLATVSENENLAAGGDIRPLEAPRETVEQVCQRASRDGNDANTLREVEGQDHITMTTILWWLRNCGYMNLLFFAIVTVTARCVGLGENMVMASWIDSKLLGSVDDFKFMGFILCVVAASTTVGIVNTYASVRMSITSARTLHAKVIKSIMDAPIDRFFDKQPVGRLINRLSYDMRHVDDGIVGVVQSLFSFCAGVMVTNSYILRVMPVSVVVCSLPFFAVSIWFIYIFRGTTVPLVFHSKFSLSSLQDLQAVVLSTCVPIRANGQMESFMARYNHYVQSVIRCQYLIYHVCKAWVQARVFLSFGVLTGLFAIGGLWSNIPMGTLSVVISMSFGQMQEFEDISLNFTFLLNVLNALQRLTKYFDVPPEAPFALPDDPKIRFRVKLERGELAGLDLLRGAEVKTLLPRGKEDYPEILVCKGKLPLLQASADGLMLELVPGRLLRDLAPGCERLRNVKGGYTISAVNNVTRGAEEMAEELCRPSATMWLDLWHKDFSMGLRVEIRELTAGYNIERNVLHNINIDISPRMKVGFAGQTGCGKSTTLLCLLRILEARGGKIKMGGIDISTIGLHALRSTVGLVPQDPTVFEGTWRYNIDPFDEYPDGRIWDALRCVHLLPYVRRLVEGINSDVSRDGANMSFGQRQLLSMARMVIRQPPVLLLDECTSALEPATQEVVQKTVLHEFPMSTIIAIAHRVETILDFDRIVVLEQGKVAEHGTVAEVMQLGGIFAGMVSRSKG